MQTSLQAKRVLRWLILVRLASIIDLVLLIILLSASFADNEELVHIFGLSHGIAFLILIGVVAMGAIQKLWSWWFVVATFITTGPPGALIGEIVIARRAKTILRYEDSKTLGLSI